MKIIYFNVNGLKGKIDSIRNIAKAENPRLITMPETKIEGTPPAIENYGWITKNCMKEKGGKAIAMT